MMSIVNSTTNYASSQRQLQQQGGIMKVLLWILGIIILAVALALFFTRGLGEAAREQLSAIKAGDLQAAYSMTSKAFQEATPFDEFKKVVEASSVLSNYSDATFTERKVENGVGYLKGTIKSSDGGQMQIEYQLVKENDKWKIQAFRLSPVGISQDQVGQDQSSQSQN